MAVFVKNQIYQNTVAKLFVEVFARFLDSNDFDDCF